MRNSLSVSDIDAYIDAIYQDEDEIIQSGIYRHVEILREKYLPGEGKGQYRDFLDLYDKIQKGGKAVSVGGSPDEVKYLHKYLRPEKTVYHTYTRTAEEAEELLEWFWKNT